MSTYENTMTYNSRQATLWKLDCLNFVKVNFSKKGINLFSITGILFSAHNKQNYIYIILIIYISPRRKEII